MNNKKETLLERILSKGIDNVFTMSLLLLLLVVYIAGAVFPNVLDLTESPRLFEGIVILVLAQLLWNLEFRKQESQLKIVVEDDMVADIISKSKVGNIGYVSILSAGLASRLTLINTLCERGIKVKVYALSDKSAFNNFDKGDVSTNLKTINKSLLLNELDDQFSFIPYDEISSARAVILYNRRGQAVHIYVGWYTYRDSGGQLIGFPNPSISSSAKHPDGRMLLQFIEKEIAALDCANESRNALR